jgi:hypothetical protein
VKASFKHRAPIEKLSRYLALEIDDLVGSINTQPLFVGAARIFSGAGSPEGIIVGTLGDHYLRTDGDSSTALYRKATGANTATGWMPFVTHGSWTPIDSSGAGLVFAAAVGEYSRIGHRFDFTGQVTYPATASGAAAIIGGLPVTATAFNSAVTIGFQAGGVAGLQARVQASTTTINVTIEITAAAVTNVQLTGAILVFSGSYRATT